MSPSNTALLPLLAAMMKWRSETRWSRPDTTLGALSRVSEAMLTVRSWKTEFCEVLNNRLFSFGLLTSTCDALIIRMSVIWTISYPNHCCTQKKNDYVFFFFFLLVLFSIYVKKEIWQLKQCMYICICVIDMYCYFRTFQLLRVFTNSFKNFVQQITNQDTSEILLYSN